MARLSEKTRWTAFVAGAVFALFAIVPGAQAQPGASGEADRQGSKTGVVAPPEIVTIAGPASHRGAHPGVVRLRNVGGDGFEIRFQEWDYREREHGDTSHKVEAVPYLVLEPGRHEMPDGSVWEVGTFITAAGPGGGPHVADDTDIVHDEVVPSPQDTLVARDVDTPAPRWERQSFASSFPERPKLFLTIQTANGPEAVTVRARNVNEEGFEAALFEEEALGDGHVEEVVGYLAIHSPEAEGDRTKAFPGLVYSLGTVEVDESGTEMVVPQPVYRIVLQEERSDDEETNHVPELVDVLGLEFTPEGSPNRPSLILAQIVSANGNDPVTLRIDGSYDPVADFIGQDYVRGAQPVILAAGIVGVDDEWGTVSDGSFGGPVPGAAPSEDPLPGVNVAPEAAGPRNRYDAPRNGGRSDGSVGGPVPGMEPGVNRPGSDIRPGFEVETPRACQEACMNDPDCRAFTFVEAGIQAEGPRCWIKDAVPAPEQADGMVSGVVPNPFHDD